MLDTLQNVVLFAFVGLLIWLYVAAPTGRD
jgi:hypothetical protein